jgi:hypothetical protein
VPEIKVYLPTLLESFLITDIYANTGADGLGLHKDSKKQQDKQTRSFHQTNIMFFCRNKKPLLQEKEKAQINAD